MDPGYHFKFSHWQLGTFQSDFEMERKSREDMAERLRKKQEELQRKDMEVKRLHSQLNKSAANQMKAEMAEMEVQPYIA